MIETTKPVLDTIDTATQPIENIQTENAMADPQTESETDTETNQKRIQKQNH